MHVAARLGIMMLVLLAAGCAQPRGDASAADARAAHPGASSAGDGTFTLRVLVTDEPHGPPLAGANVVATFKGISPGSVAVVTDDAGRAELRLPASREIALSAWKQGWTLERPRVAATGASGTSTDLTLPLFREDVAVELPGRLSPAGASTRAVDGRDVKWEPQRVDWSASPEATHAYNARLVLTNVTLTWTNGPTGAGDLLIAGGRSASHADAVSDEASQFGPGPQTEKASVPFAVIQRAGWRQADVLFVGAGTGKAWVAPLGLEYKLVVRGHFDGNTNLHDSPGGATVAAVVGLAASAFLLPRRPKA